MQKTETEWKNLLTPQQYEILRQKGTEAPFSGEHLNNNESGIYTCAGCGAELFLSGAKHESKTPGLQGWPSFADVAKAGAVRLVPDSSLGMERTEVQCAKCGGHLGHLFDGVNDTPTGKHYCINSTCLDFQPKTESK
ncbi:MAG: peptide-methionine (R)-S-oxide reductase MsrB [Patescibacteria group bacterium]